jgi:ubiquinone biosynthesis protein
MRWRDSLFALHGMVRLAGIVLLRLPRLLLAAGKGTDAVPRTIERLGPAYVKFAQLASTREDVLPHRLCVSLRSLREDGRPLPAEYVRKMLARSGLVVTNDGEHRLIGAGSVGCVYLVGVSGTPTAIKILRPGVRGALRRDLAVVRAFARVLARLPWFRHLPVTDMVDYISGIVLAQADLVAERDNLESLDAGLSRHGVVIPKPSAARADFLAMEYLPVFDRRHRGAEPDADLKRAASLLTAAVFRMLFTVGSCTATSTRAMSRSGPTGRCTSSTAVSW